MSALPSTFARTGIGRLHIAVMQADPEDDAALLRAHRAGDPRAFARLYDRHDRPCFLFIRRALGRAFAESAEDLHQDTWVSVARHAATFDPRKGGFRAWLFTIARRKVWDHFRRQKAAVLALARDEAASRVPDPGPTPLERVESRELAQRLVGAVEALPLAQRETFLLFAQADLSLEETARATGVGLETAKSRLRYARAALRQALADERSTHVRS
jgi:RNA polymerase sigma-70 factor (ECF subfamily)